MPSKFSPQLALKSNPLCHTPHLETEIKDGADRRLRKEAGEQEEEETEGFSNVPEEVTKEALETMATIMHACDRDRLRRSE